ncbi:unnamed protein product [Albugo candida]|uniref:Uncharacterized protein n=1 Tax=Albugo candida TaxID=65357 RepID=A0A024GTG5_9STRA|nr:unnamed protein product [Albugo candida]|eukprot:CCI49991.1 unnamed protein product [Albugo candida]
MLQQIFVFNGGPVRSIEETPNLTELQVAAVFSCYFHGYESNSNDEAELSFFKEVGKYLWERPVVDHMLPNTKGNRHGLILKMASFCLTNVRTRKNAIPK